MSGVRAILEFPGSPRTVYSHPAHIIAAHDTAGVRDALRRVEQATRGGATAVGFVAYEAAPAFDRALVTRAPAAHVPLLWFALFDGAPVLEPAPACAALPALAWEVDATPAQFAAAIGDIRDGIAAGDVYQVNHTLRFVARCTAEPVALYDALAAPRHGLYHALLETPEWAVVSASPELFIDVRDGRITTRPMKGTMRRGRWLEEDRAAAAALATSAKDRAENLMIVDLLRNDLGRIARFGTVAVPRIHDVETYPTVHQMTSTITGELRADVRLDDIFAAMFPCGSVTGAPKVTAMQRIARLEQSARGPYCGAVGIVRADGSATFNVAIRTLLLDRATGTATYGAGAGITWDSRAAAEYDEVVAKAALLHHALPPFELIETLRLQDGAYRRLDLHLARLRDSAAYWNFPAHTAAAAQEALEHERSTAARGAWRIRLTAARNGAIDITRTLLDTAPPAVTASPAVTPSPAVTANTVRTVRTATTAVSSRDPLLYHKTTARATYDARRAEHPDAFDVLLHNEDGCITEFTTGNVVVELDGQLLTPARECGLLAGTMRAQLLRDGVIREACITLADVRRAQRIWFINSVRECLPVRLA